MRYRCSLVSRIDRVGGSVNSAIQGSINESRALRRGDAVAAASYLGKRAWRAGVPAGTVGIVRHIDWLGDLRVEFTLDGDWLSRQSTVEKVVAACDLHLIHEVKRSVNRV